MEADLLVDDLREQIAKGQVVVVIGAGVSIGATNNHPCASWTGLLHDGVKRCEAVVPSLPKGWADRVRGEIDSGDMGELLSAAEKISERLGAPGGGEYRSWLRASFEKMTVHRREVIEALHGLGVPLATTNYDGLIEEVTGLRAITWRESSAVERVVREHQPERKVIHLHGYWENAESVILGIRSYGKVLGDAHAQIMLRALQALKTLLFVGCGEGLHDPNFGALLEWTGQLFAGSEYRRFRLARTNECEVLQRQHPPEQRLFVLPYGEHHDQLAPFLRSLGTYRPSRAPAASVGVSSAASVPLPARPYCFGRETEVEDLVANMLLAQPEPTPILGPPGIGKSTISIVALHDARVATRYGTRRYFVRCDGVRSRTDLAAAIAIAIGVPPSPQIESAMIATLGAAPTALLLDNVETPWEADTLAVEELLGLLAEVHGVALIVSIRGNQRPMGVRWCEPFRPPPLPPPAARAAFLAIAGNHFAADQYLDDILTAVEHVPLAITLLAAVAEGEPTLTGIWQRWQVERTAMLRRADGATRLTNLELSYELSLTSPRVTTEAKRLLFMLALVPNSLAQIDLPAIFPEHGDTTAAVLRKAGLAFDEAQGLRVLAPLREYIRRVYPPETTDATRLIAHFVHLARAFGDKVGRKGGADAIQRLVPEAANIDAMLSLALANAAITNTIEAVLAWGECIRFTGVGRGLSLEQAATTARQQGDHRGEANCIGRLGDIALARSDHATATTRYETALPLYRQVGAVLGEANCIGRLGDIALARSDHATAKEQFVAALVLYERIAEPYSIGMTHRRLARLATDTQEKSHHVQTARASWERIDRPDLLAELDAEFGAGNT